MVCFLFGVSQILDQLGIIASVLEVGLMVGWGLFHMLEKMGFQLWQDLVLLCSLQELDLCICPNLMDPFHSFLRVGLRYL